MRRVVTAAALLLLASCTFGSETPLLDEGDGVALLGDGQTMRMEEGPNGDADLMRFVRDGDAYLMSPPGEGRSMRVAFVPITSTPEEDYIAQLRLDPDGQGVAYAFVWRYGDRLRAIAAPSSVGEDEPDPRFCQVQSMRQCQFNRRQDAIGYYRERIYPRFVVGDEAPSTYLELTPETQRPSK